MIKRNQSILVLSVPHRTGPNVDCSLICTMWCLSCSHIDLTSELAGNGGNTTFVMGKGAERTVFTIVHTYDPNCAHTDRYTITGGPVDHFSLPSFEGDGRCNPGYPANPEHVCFNSSTVTFLDTRQGDTVGTVELEQDGVNLFVTYNVTPHTLRSVNLWVGNTLPASDSSGPLKDTFPIKLMDLTASAIVSVFGLSSLQIACDTYPAPYKLYVAAYATLANFSNPAGPPLEAWGLGPITFNGTWATVFTVRLDCNCSNPEVSPQCGANSLAEVSINPVCRPVTACELESAACYPDNASFPLHSFQLRDCGAPAAGGYEFAIGRSSIADPRPVTGATCLIVQVNGTLLVLTVPHRHGTVDNCSQYCNHYCPEACQLFDLTDQDHDNATFQFGGVTFQLTSGPSPRCGSTDLYALRGGRVQQISVPTFTPDPTCAPGTNITYGGKRFVCSAGAASDWIGAQTAARSLGGQLATIRTPYELAQAQGLCCTSGLVPSQRLWIGGRKEADGSWQWQPGGNSAEHLGWENFGSPQGSGNCLDLGGDGKWYAGDCTVAQLYLLEVPAGPAGLVSFTGPAEVCFSAPEAAGLGCLWRYVLHNDELVSRNYSVTSTSDFLNITFNGLHQDYLNLAPCQAAEVCVGLASAPSGSQALTLQFAVDAVVRDTRTVALDLLPTPIIGTSTDPGTATSCQIYESSSADYLELWASEADPLNLFVSMTAVDANDTSRVYGSA
eukprot:EG_transcript_226